MMKRAFDHMPMGAEGLKEIYAWIDRYAEDHADIAQKIILGKSEDDVWDVPAVVVTNRSVPDDEKQVAIITLTRHGNERGTRVVGPEILNYLASGEAGETRDKQIVVVVPVLNPVGMVLDEFNSSLYGITDHEKKIMGKLCAMYTPDMMLDYHSLGKTQGEKFDLGDMEVIIPANSTRWGMDEQIYQLIAERLRETAAEEGWPYEVHTLEDLNLYYFAERNTGRIPHKYVEEKVFLLHIQNAYEHYDGMGYTNYTNGPAYMKWHTLVFGVETNHYSIKIEDGLGESGACIAKELLNMGNRRFAWEKCEGYPANLIAGDYRISIRSFGKTPAKRRISRETIWKERVKFNILKREILDDPTLTLAKVGYMGEDAPPDFELCLRMRQEGIKQVFVDGKEAAFETRKDNCSTYLFIPVSMDKPGVSDIQVIHEPYRRDSAADTL